MSANSIHNLKTVAIGSGDNARVAVIMGLNIPDDDTADAFVGEAAEKFKLQRMCSPPHTDVLLITLVGNIPASRFVARWREIAAGDQILAHFMSTMSKADVVRGRPDGTPLETVSLIDEPSAVAPRESSSAPPLPITTLFTAGIGTKGYDSTEAYQRWQGRLGPAITEIRARHKRNQSFLLRLRILDPVRALWGVFTRAFWPIYMPGAHGHHGSVVMSFDPFFDDSPALFEISEDLRRLRDASTEPKHLSAFARVLRNDYKAPDRIEIPQELAGGRTVYFQSIYIPRNCLPGGYLHHRLVPIAACRRRPTAKILPLKLWPEEFQRTWQLGKPPLDADTLADYQRRSPQIKP